ncbi:MAG: hypothetical protein IRZ13_11680 [Acetobacteraceae bacterium]|nr:hypothetical protein [Acetobacteraceae bacterium]
MAERMDRQEVDAALTRAGLTQLTEAERESVASATVHLLRLRARVRAPLLSLATEPAVVFAPIGTAEASR